MLKRTLLFLFSVSAFFVLPTSGAQQGGRATDFRFPPEVTQAGIEHLAELGDPSLKTLEELFPGFRTSYPLSVTKLAELALRHFATPVDLWPIMESQRNSRSPDPQLNRTSYIFTKFIKNLELFAFEEAMRDAAPGYEEPEQRHYVYCEKFPERQSRFCEYHPSFSNNLRWTFARRLLSSARFVEAACPVITPVAVWQLNWNASDEFGRAQILKFLNELQDTLEFIYGDGEWSTARLNKLVDSSPMDISVVLTLVRRYLDGGPEFIAAAENCLDEIRWAYDDVQAQEGSDHKIAQILKFESVSLNGPGGSASIEIQTAPFSREVRYRLSHDFIPEKNIPPARPPEVEGRYYWEYLETIDDLAAPTLHNLTHLAGHLSRIDSRFNYRSITREEFIKLSAVGKAPVGYTHFCVAEPDPASGSFRYFSFDENMEVEESDGSNLCPENGVLLVRERINLPPG